MDNDNRAAIIGFSLMLAGPIMLILAGLLTDSFGHMSRTSANVVSWTAAILPGIGTVICYMLFFRWKKVGKLGRALSIVTVIMCNPFFYFYYFIICLFAGNTLAGLSWM